MDEEEKTTNNNNNHKVSRARSLGRSRARNHPSELLARKQQLVSSSAELAWSSSASKSSQNDDDDNVEVRLPRSRTKYDIQQSSERRDNNERASSVEARLESLSLMLRDHQTSGDASDQSTVTSGITGNQQSTGNQSAAGKSIDDVYILLAKKEKDLQLAAELGKVLLEKNDELSKANERITEEYSHKLEVSFFNYVYRLPLLFKCLVLSATGCVCSCTSVKVGQSRQECSKS